MSGELNGGFWFDCVVFTGSLDDQLVVGFRYELLFQLFVSRNFLNNTLQQKK